MPSSINQLPASHVTSDVSSETQFHPRHGRKSLRLFGKQMAHSSQLEHPQVNAQRVHEGTIGRAQRSTLRDRRHINEKSNIVLAMITTDDFRERQFLLPIWR